MIRLKLHYTPTPPAALAATALMVEEALTWPCPDPVAILDLPAQTGWELSSLGLTTPALKRGRYHTGRLYRPAEVVESWPLGPGPWHLRGLRAVWPQAVWDFGGDLEVEVRPERDIRLEFQAPAGWVGAVKV